MKAVPLAAAVATTLAACAPGDVPPATIGAPGSARACFIPDTVRNFRPANDSVVYVRAGRNEVYEVNSAFCRGLSNAQSIALSSGIGGGSACVDDSITIQLAGPGLASGDSSRCQARVTRRLTEEEVAALPSRLRP